MAIDLAVGAGDGDDPGEAGVGGGEGFRVERRFVEGDAVAGERGRGCQRRRDEKGQRGFHGAP